MIKGLIELHDFIQNELNPVNLARLEQINQKEEIWNRTWAIQSQLIKQQFIGNHQTTVSLNTALLTDLTILSNQGYLYLTRYTALWKDKPIAGQIRQFYRRIINQLNELINAIASFNIEALADVPYTYYDLPTIVQQMKKDYNLLEERLSSIEIDRELRDICLKALFNMIRTPHLTRRNMLYFDKLIQKLMQLPELSNLIIKNTLYSQDFNQPEFFMYWIDDWNQMLNEEPDLHQQLEIVIREQDQLRGLPVQRNSRLLAREEPLSRELKHFLAEKKQTLKELIKLRRTRFKDHEILKMAMRVKINLPVAQLALFIRLQLEKGILLKDHVGKIFSFYATHFYTAQTENISPESLQKKSTEVEYATAQKLKAMLISMINWLNENFKLDS